MKDYAGKIQYKDHEYKLVFNFNVMEEIQNTYGTLEAWGDLTDGTEYAKRSYEALGKKKSWEELTASEQAKYTGEPDAKAVIYGFMLMINEGIDIENEDNGTDIKPLTQKQVGRLITEYGLGRATKVMNDTVVESTKSQEKN